MKQFWLEKHECTGCGACSNVCPKNAISMQPDSCGFIYPEIGSACVDCGLCEKVCKQRQASDKDNNEIPDTYAAWTKDRELRYSSTSGGAFSELAKHILSQGGCVAGALYNEDNLVEHAVVYDEAGLEKLRQSKYIQSDTKSVYREIKKLLNEGRLVAFCGSPCQVSALYAFLGKKYDRLITFDFICRGMNSPKAYKSWLKEIERDEGKQVNRVWFKYKSGGWKKSPRCTRVDFEDGTFKVYDQKENLFMSAYLGPNLYIRPCCGDCDFKGVPRVSDITLADFWGIDSELDDDMGTSMLLINSHNGEELFAAVRESMNVYKRDFSEIFAGNVCFKESARINPKSKAFLESLDRIAFSRAVAKFTREKLSKRVYKKIKSFCRRIKKR